MTDICETKWQEALASHISKISDTSIDDDWEEWCQAFQKFHNCNGVVLGLQPRFRLRDQFKHTKHHHQLGQAIKNQDWQQHKILL